MSLQTVKANTPGLKVDDVNFGVDANIAGSCLVRIDEVPAGSEFFMFLGLSSSSAEGISIGIRNTKRLYVWPRMGGFNSTVTGADDVQEFQLGRWHRVSWAIHQTGGADPICTIWFDGEVALTLALTGYGAVKPAISGWDRIAFGNRYDVSPASYIDAMLQDAAVWVGTAASLANSTARHAALYNTGSHKRITDSDYASETPFANWRFDLESGTPTVGDTAFIDQQGTNHINTILAASGVSYVAKNMERVTTSPYFGRVRQSHYNRLVREGTSRRVLCIGDSHMNKDPADRFMEGVAKRWPIPDWVSRTTGFRTSGGVESGSTIVSVAAGTIETEARPGESALGGVSNNIWGHGTDWLFASDLNTSLFLLRLSDYADGAYYHASSGGAPQWFNGVKYGGRPIIYYDGGVNSVTGIRSKAARGASTGPFTTLSFSEVGWQVVPIQAGSGSTAATDTAIDIAVTGSESHPTNAKHIFCAGAQVCVLEEDNATVKAGFAIDAFAPYGWDTVDHERESGPSRYYSNANAEGYINATRLRSDEHMILMILLSHEIGVKATYKTQMQGVIDRWRTICENQGYSNPDIWLIGAWRISVRDPASMDDERDVLAELQDENSDVSFIALSAYQQHLVYDGTEGNPQYLDGAVGSGVHWDTLAGTEFWGDELYDCVVASVEDTDIRQRESQSSRSRDRTGGLRRTHRSR